MSYSTGIVYKIVCTQDSGIVYIGSTFNLLRQRWQMHKNHYKRYLDGKYGYISIYPYFSKYGIENFKILKIKEYECYREHIRDHKHLEMYEQLWINKTKGCVNQKSAFCIKKLTEKEYYEKNKEQLKEHMKEYYEKNSEQLKEKSKEYYEKNKEQLKEHMKEYYEKNKERKKEKVECEICKSIISKGALYLHKKSKKHIKNLEKNIV